MIRREGLAPGLRPSLPHSRQGERLPEPMMVGATRVRNGAARTRVCYTCYPC
jgi:hypothetical protein